MFLLVPAHPGFPGQIPQSRKTVVCVCVCVYRVLEASANATIILTFYYYYYYYYNAERIKVVSSVPV